ncbi:MAG TPA: glycosyltransferase family 2 protein [Burkholderiales bacterium]
MAPSAPGHPASPPRISVITVVRNGVRFVGQTIESVLMQRYADLEYIVVDGGSTDGTVDVIKSHETQLAKWVSERDEGIADAFNKGISYSTGDYVLFLNADDALANPDVIDMVARNIVGNGSPVLLYGDCDVLDRDSGEVLYRASIDVPHKKLLLGKMIPHPSLFTHRSYFEKYGRFDPSFRIAMDYEWLLRGGLTERVVHVPLLVTNVRDGGMSTLDQKRVVDEIISALKKNRYISSTWAELKMRGYYLSRSFAKSFLDGIGLYTAFSRFRNRRQGRDLR